MTLVEYGKGLEKTNPVKPVIEVFARESDIFGALPIVGFSGAAYEFYRQSTKPDNLAFRGLNESPTSGRGVITPFQEPSYPLDHHMDVDRAIVERMGEARRGVEDVLSISAAARMWADAFIAGDHATEPREFDGLKARVTKYGATTETNTRLFHNSTASGGAALSLAKLDILLNSVRNVTHLIMPRQFKPRLTAAARSTTVAGFVMQTWDEVGKQKFSYAGIPILFGYEREPDSEFLDFDEVGNGGGSAVTTSIYAVSFSETGLHGIQINPMSVVDKGLLEDGVTMRRHLSWDTGIVDEEPFCLGRLTSITDAAIVA
jgi:hypothetical protein